MTSENRQAKRITVELPVEVCLFDNRRETRLGEPISGRISNFSPIGAALRIATILLNGNHLFYACQDNPDIVLELTFELSSSKGKMLAVPASPVWFDRNLDAESTQFVLGLKFLINPKSPAIKALSKEACQDEKRLVSLWKKFF